MMWAPGCLDACGVPGYPERYDVLIFSSLLPLFCTDVLPAGSHKDENNVDFRIFKKQMYHAALVRIFDPVKPYMTTPCVTCCPNGHYQKVIYSLGPFIADYPEQVYLSGIVQGWCLKSVHHTMEI